MTKHIRNIAIVGAGIAGLTTALCIARRGIASDVFEQAQSLDAVGAGLQLSPNASRILAELGLRDALATFWSEPDHILLASGRSLALLASVPAGRAARDRWGAPYGVLHRASLQSVLLSAVEQEPLCRLVTGTMITNTSDLAATVRGEAGLVVGADGVWSKIRAEVPGAAQATFSGNVAWRFLLPYEDAPAFLNPRTVTAYLGSDAHIVAYPLTESNAFNIVAIHRAPRPTADGWSRTPDEAAKRGLLQSFRGWNGEILRILQEARAPLMWPLYECADGRWHDGDRLVLIGDAAHAMTPFAAQGAAMAIEDAALLAHLLTESTDIPANLRRFENQRRERVARVRARGAFNRFAYHARGPLALGRNLVLSLRSPASLAADFDWLYGYRTPT